MSGHHLVGVLLAAILLGGCGKDFPSFGRHNILSNAGYLYHIPAEEVMEQVKCEIASYINRKGQRGVDSQPVFDLNTEKDIDVKLTLKTDTTYGVGYKGINLDKVGLSSLASLIKIDKGVPELEADLAMNPTLSAKLAFKFKAKDFRASSGRSAKVRCPDTQYYLEDWLVAFFKARADAKGKYSQDLGLEFVTLTTDFEFAVGVSSKLNPLVKKSTFILPVSGVGFEYKPKFVHSLEIQFPICHAGDCSKPEKTVIAHIKEASEWADKAKKAADKAKAELEKR